MQKWHEYSNYRRKNNPDGTITYIVIIDGCDVEVDEKVYRVYAYYGRKMKYMELDIKRNRVLQDKDGNPVIDGYGNRIDLPEREVSLDKLMDEEWEFPSSEQLPEDAVIRSVEIDVLREGIDTLGEDDKKLINALFADEMTIRDYAESIGNSKSSVARQKARVLMTLRNFIKFSS